MFHHNCEMVFKVKEPEELQKISSFILTLKPPAQSITVINAPLIVIGQGPLPKRNSNSIFISSLLLNLFL